MIRGMLCALLIMGAAEVQPSGRILVTTSDYTVISMVRELDERFPKLLLDPTLPQDEVTIEVVDDLRADQDLVGSSKGDRIWGVTTYEGNGENHHHVKLSKRMFNQPNGHVVFMSVLAHELVHVGLLARGEVPLNTCEGLQHEMTAYSMQIKVEKWKLDSSNPETEFTLMQMQHAWMRNCSEDEK